MNENEAKYDAPAGRAVPHLGGLPQVAGTSEPQEVQLEAEYYDTGDLRLFRAGITLRHRRGGDDAGWRIKLPVSGKKCREIRLPPGQAGGQVPPELADLVQVHTRGEPLAPVARITTKRQLLILLDQGGGSLAEIADDDVRAQTMGGSTTASQWHEVEVQLTGGDQRLLKAADKVLRRQGLRPAGHAAKLERALGQQPRPARQQPLKPSTPAGQVVLAYLRAQAGTLKSLDPMVRKDEPDSVHKMRVATRRLRSTLRSFGNVVRRDQTERLATELKWLGTVLGAVRDAEVLPAHLREALWQTPVEQVIGPVQARVAGHFAPVHVAARTALLAAFRSPRYYALLDDLDRLLADPPLTPLADEPAAQVLPATARRARRKVARRMRRARHAAAGQPRNAALHRARKAAKRARYAGEAITPAVGKKARRFTRQMKKLQSVLGEHQDAVIARQAARDLGISAHLAGENSFTYGLLYGRDTCASERLQAQALRTWKHASRPRYRRWMGSEEDSVSQSRAR
ncbi:MAG TPA: CYTH and CHAD domain-containing protein [Streptosporangiaceae bacterium]|nr:CYTH and CHAD domain-containing protein [Streptosporangiaceae bacterium]